MSPLVDTALLVIILIVVLIVLYLVWWLYNNARQNNDNFDELSDELKQIGKLLLLEEGLDAVNPDSTTAPSASTTVPKKKVRKSLFAGFKLSN